MRHQWRFLVRCLHFKTIENIEFQHRVKKVPKLCYVTKLLREIIHFRAIAVSVFCIVMIVFSDRFVKKTLGVAVRQEGGGAAGTNM